MDRRKRLLVCLAGLSICMGFLLTEEITVQAGEKEGHDFMCSGVGTVLDPNDFTVDEPEKQQEELNIYQKFEAEQARMETELAMANVQNALNVRAQANEKSEKVGFLYKDCGGTILEQENGWTKIKSGNVIGWAKDEYLVFGEDAEKMAEDVGNWIVKLNSEAVRVRMEPNEEAETICYLAKDDAVDFIEIVNDEWVSIDYEGAIGYVRTEYIQINFHIDEGETIEVVRAREREAAERKRIANRGAVSADADETRLLAALKRVLRRTACSRCGCHEPCEESGLSGKHLRSHLFLRAVYTCHVRKGGKGLRRKHSGCLHPGSTGCDQWRNFGRGSNLL